jgi:hypothetical protein
MLMVTIGLLSLSIPQPKLFMLETQCITMGNGPHMLGVTQTLQWWLAKSDSAANCYGPPYQILPLPITQQDNTSSCGIFAQNALSAYFMPLQCLLLPASSSILPCIRSFMAVTEAFEKGNYPPVHTVFVISHVHTHRPTQQTPFPLPTTQWCWNMTNLKAAEPMLCILIQHLVILMMTIINQCPRPKRNSILRPVSLQMMDYLPSSPKFHQSRLTSLIEHAMLIIKKNTNVFMPKICTESSRSMVGSVCWLANKSRHNGREKKIMGLRMVLDHQEVKKGEVTGTHILGYGD